MLWQEQSWPDIEALDKDIPVMVPLGAIEQHGRHLPLCVDTIQVTEIAQRVERQLPSGVLLTPTQWLGSSHHHLDFPGTLSVGPSLYSQMVKAIAQCIIKAGFKRIFFLNGHGGNRVPGAQALSELVTESEEADATLLAMTTWWHIGADAIRPEKHDMASPSLSHACEYETSMALFLRPDLVKMDQFVRTPPAMATKWFHTEYPSRPVQVFNRFHRRTGAGNLGAGGDATAEKGRTMTAGVVDEIVSFLKDFRTWPMMSKLGPA